MTSLVNILIHLAKLVNLTRRLNSKVSLRCSKLVVEGCPVTLVWRRSNVVYSRVTSTKYNVTDPLEHVRYTYTGSATIHDLIGISYALTMLRIQSCYVFWVDSFSGLINYLRAFTSSCVTCSDRYRYQAFRCTRGVCSYRLKQRKKLHSLMS